jgi:hypothetical protein
MMRRSFSGCQPGCLPLSAAAFGWILAAYLVPGDHVTHEPGHGCPVFVGRARELAEQDAEN